MCRLKHFKNGSRRCADGGGRGSSSGLRKNDLGLTKQDINTGVNKVIDFIERNPKAYGSLTSDREEEFRKIAKKMYEKGFSGLEEGRIVDYSRKNMNLYIIKEDGGLNQYYLRPTQEQSTLMVRDGIVVGKKGEKVKEVKILSRETKYKYLTRAILLRLNPHLRYSHHFVYGKSREK